ncbi:uncharacterized protein LOC124698739 [Lolium rigidum]|uniref:uncharacterized protein LOC124698739 n=1 Tax=Lolium rigidum TaxID=89674 RepID=UPI001F5CA2C4|nr:uncharacterized protein LOC124698739 [Lolium rigidum]
MDHAKHAHSPPAPFSPPLLIPLQAKQTLAPLLLPRAATSHLSSCFFFSVSIEAHIPSSSPWRRRYRPPLVEPFAPGDAARRPRHPRGRNRAKTPSIKSTVADSPPRLSHSGVDSGDLRHHISVLSTGRRRLPRPPRRPSSPATSAPLPPLQRRPQGEQHPLPSPLPCMPQHVCIIEREDEIVLKTKTKTCSFDLFHGGHFRRRSSPAQSISAPASCFSRCTTSPAIYWFLNHPKRSSNGVVIVFPSSVQKLVSVFGPVSLFRRLVFRRSSPAFQTSSARADGFNRCTPPPAPSLFLVRAKPCPIFDVTETLKSVQI